MASSSQSSKNIGQMRISLPKLAQACDRTGVSDRAAAIIASAVLEDLNIVTSSDTSKIIEVKYAALEKGRDLIIRTRARKL